MNKIATQQYVASLIGSSVTDGDKCATKKWITDHHNDVLIDGTYTNDQLVKQTDLSVGAKTYLPHKAMQFYRWNDHTPSAPPEKGPSMMSSWGTNGGNSFKNQSVFALPVQRLLDGWGIQNGTTTPNATTGIIFPIVGPRIEDLWPPSWETFVQYRNSAISSGNFYSQYMNTSTKYYFSASLFLGLAAQAGLQNIDGYYLFGTDIYPEPTTYSYFYLGIGWGRTPRGTWKKEDGTTEELINMAW